MTTDQDGSKSEFTLPRARVEPTPRWVRVKVGGEVVADSRDALLLLDYGPHILPTYFFSPDDVRMDLLDAKDGGENGGGRRRWTVAAGGTVVENGAWSPVNPTPPLEALEGRITFVWDDPALAWFEEAEQVFVHARDPYKRVDTVQSSRHVRVEVDGVTVAESDRPLLLFETHLPTRYYLPPEDVRQDLLEASTLTSACPYKGQATYWSVRVGETLHENLIWGYRDPIPENPKIRGLMAFYNEKVEIFVDGEREPRPVTPFS